MVNLVLLDDSYARSLKYQLNRIKKDISKLPDKNTNIGINKSQQTILNACNLIDNVSAKGLIVLNKDRITRSNLETLLASLSDMLHKTSMAITDTYFNHSDQQKQLV